MLPSLASSTYSCIDDCCFLHFHHCCFHLHHHCPQNVSMSPSSSPHCPKNKLNPDAFHVFATASTAAVVACPVMNIYIPNLRSEPLAIRLVKKLASNTQKHLFKCTNTKTQICSYDGIKTLAGSAPTASTAATYNYQSEILPPSSLHTSSHHHHMHVYHYLLIAIIRKI